MAAFQSAAENAAAVLNLIAWIVLGGAAVVMGFIVTAEEDARAADIAIRKALGARPAQVKAALMAEFGLLGALAGVAGALLGSGIATALLSAIFRKLVIAAAWQSIAAIPLGAAVAATAAGIATASLMRRRPISILREQ
jgi:putative ABC transport system permease protein